MGYIVAIYFKVLRFYLKFYSVYIEVFTYFAPAMPGFLNLTFLTYARQYFMQH